MDLRRTRKSPILLVPGTYLGPDWFNWNYLPALAAQGWPVCTIRLPENATAPIQVSAKYIAYAIRTAHRLSGHKVHIIGFSQGGMDPRWVLRFAPETRHMVDDLISLGASNHGAEIATVLCDIAPSPDADGVVGCPASLWQQRPQSRFLATLNAGHETVPEVDYTAIYSTVDPVIGSGSGPEASSALRDRGRNVANIAVQDLCPASFALHFDLGSFDPVAYAIVVDALEHTGPAIHKRLLLGGAPGTPSFCAATFMPGVDPATFEQDFTAALVALNEAFFGAKNLGREPGLPCYAHGRHGYD